MWMQRSKFYGTYSLVIIPDLKLADSVHTVSLSRFFFDSSGLLLEEWNTRNNKQMPEKTLIAEFQVEVKIKIKTIHFTIF